jgi:hypothetical protein
VSRLPQIFTNWRWSRRLGYDRLQVSDEAKVSGGSSNETEDIVIRQQRIRDLVARGRKALVRATVELEQSDYCFETALEMADNRAPESRDSDLADDPWVSKKERRRLEQAQKERHERGEDVP